MKYQIKRALIITVALTGYLFTFMLYLEKQKAEPELRMANYCFRALANEVHEHNKTKSEKCSLKKKRKK